VASHEGAREKRSMQKRKGRHADLRRRDGLRRYGQPAIFSSQLRAELNLSRRNLRGHGQSVLDL